MSTPGDRVKRVIYWLKSMEIIKQQNDVALLLGCNKQYLSQVVNNLAPVSEKFVANFKEKFDMVNPDYILLGRGRMVKFDPTTTKERIIIELQGQLIEKTETIQQLQNTVIELQNQLILLKSFDKKQQNP